MLGGGPTYYTWTADGAMATKHEGAGWTYYTWDVDESLTKIQAPDTTLSNKYNSRMQRVARDEDGVAENLIYDSQKLIAEAGLGGLGRYYLSEGGSVYSPLVSQTGSQEWHFVRGVYYRFAVAGARTHPPTRIKFRRWRNLAYNLIVGAIFLDQPGAPPPWPEQVPLWARHRTTVMLSQS